MTEILYSLLDAVKDATGINPAPFQTKDYADSLPAITYSFYCSNDNGATARYRFLTRVHAKSYQQCLEIAAKLSDALTTVGDSTRFGCSIKGNGGGSLVDEETNIPQQIQYFDITSRS